MRMVVFALLAGIVLFACGGDEPAAENPDVKPGAQPTPPVATA